MEAVARTIAEPVKSPSRHRSASNDGLVLCVALYFGIASGVLQFIKPPTDADAVFFFAFVAFLAGFSERWVRDILVPKSRTGDGQDS